MLKLKILVACEYSGIVRDAFNRAGHDAMSADLLPSESPGKHYQGNVFDVLQNETFDMMIAFPPCTYLAQCQMAQMLNSKSRMRKALTAYCFVRRLFDADIPRIAIENPVGALSTIWRKPDQIVSPGNFGDNHSKKICLWLKNLSPLISTVYNNKKQPVSNHVNSRMSQALKSKIKSKFFPLVADAMANQWNS